MEIRLKKWEMDDREALMTICNAVDRRCLSDRIPHPYTEEDAEWWLNMVGQREGKDGVFRAVVVDGRIVGTISVEQKQDVYRMDAEIGYFLATEQWSRGIMTEAVGRICDIAFQKLNIIRITGLVYEANIASGRVLLKNGFALEGVMRNAVFKNGAIDNLRIYGKLKAAQTANG